MLKNFAKQKYNRPNNNHYDILSASENQRSATTQDKRINVCKESMIITKQR